MAECVKVKRLVISVYHRFLLTSLLIVSSVLSKRMDKIPRRQRANQTRCAVYICYICPFQSRWLSSVRRHMKRHGLPDKLVCALCDQKFKNKICLNKHIALHEAWNNHMWTVWEEIFRSYGEVTPSICRHTWNVRALLAVSEKVPWFNLFYHNWYIIYISTRGHCLASYDTFDNSYVPYRDTFQTVHPKNHTGAMYNHGCSVLPRH